MTETRVSRRFAVTFALAAALSQAAPAADVAAFAAKRIWPGDGPPIADAVMVVTDGKITAIGPRATTTIPAGATLRDFGAAELIPGLIVAEASLGESARDDARTVTPEQRAIDGFDFFGDHHRLLSSGVTAVQISPGTSRLAPGQGAVVKLAGADPAARTLAEVESLRLVLTSASRNPPTLY
ncbi:MAG TPA: hypothetical protein VNC50_18905, partial [Planctomycetia bacterium]|nr:hypothetical protein [Planctomycetia bacterium]